MPKSNWMIRFDKKLKEMEKPLRRQVQYSTYDDIELKLEKLKQHYSTEIYRLSNSAVIRGLISSFYDITFPEKKEK